MTTRALLSLSLSLLLGCHAQLATPKGFAEIEARGAFVQRATSARGVVIGVRELSAPDGASLDFWRDAITERLVRGRGYALLEEREVRAKHGVVGTLLCFGHDQNGHTYDYWVAVFGGPKRVTLVEAGGRREVFAEAKPAVQAAITSLELR
jgi:hypothetical protein